MNPHLRQIRQLAGVALGLEQRDLLGKQKLDLLAKALPLR